MGRITDALQNKLIQAGFRITVEDYLERALFLIIGIPVIAYIVGAPPNVVGALILILLGLTMYIPFRLARWRAELAEAELPYVMRVIASEVEAGIPFIEALKSGARAGKVLGQGLERTTRLYAKGIPVERALARVGEWYDSENVRRAFAHLAVLYQTGREASTIKKISDEMIAVQRARYRRLSAELAMYALFFIAITGLVPALFEMYVSLGSLFMSMTITDVEAFWVPAVVFPLISASSLAFVYARLPAFARR